MYEMDPSYMLSDQQDKTHEVLCSVNDPANYCLLRMRSHYDLCCK